MATKTTELALYGAPGMPHVFTAKTAAVGITIDGNTKLNLTVQYDAVMLVSDNANDQWWLL